MCVEIIMFFLRKKYKIYTQWWAPILSLKTYHSPFLGIIFLFVLFDQEL